MTCFYSRRTDKKCNCPNPGEYRNCVNMERASAKRFDGASFHSKEVDGLALVRADYCVKQHCIDYKPMENCAYSTETEQKWVGDLADCYVVECRNPQAQKKLKSFVSKDGVALHGVRRPCDSNFNLIPNANYLQVRSRFCNKQYCPYFTAPGIDKNEGCKKDEQENNKQ